MQDNLTIKSLGFVFIIALLGCSKPELKGDNLLYYNFCQSDDDCQLVEKNGQCLDAANKHDIELAKEIYSRQLGCNFEPPNPVAKCNHNQCVVESVKPNATTKPK